ncbi:MAG: hypothetical protein PHN31_01840 [Candidatus Gracilibacteria bacterium]|nr:hypothetical protein [Candidatus Gracilibacteria bacterium]
MKKIGFIGQGFLGGNQANDFEQRGYEVVRYSKNRFSQNLELMQECEIVFVGVPTPTINRKFVGDTLFKAIKNTVAGQKIIIKSTVLPGTTDKLQELYPDRFFFHSGEFLAEKTAKYDVENPTRNVVGCTEQSKDFARDIARLLPNAPTVICTAKESELGKYFSNFLLTGKVILANLMYDICEREGENYDMIKQIAALDPRIGPSHLDIQDDGGRGANGHCFPKDISTLQEYYDNYNELGNELFEALQMYNLDINTKTNKHLEIINPIYGIE